jgi:hypothetical protein
MLDEEVDNQIVMNASTSTSASSSDYDDINDGYSHDDRGHVGHDPTTFVIPTIISSLYKF